MHRDEIAQRIDVANLRLGHNLGGSLLGCPWSNLNRPEVALITMNPGGLENAGLNLSEERGSIYVVQDWLGAGAGQAPLQRQVQRLFHFTNFDIDAALAGYLVPFRSRSWAELRSPAESLAFGIDLWRKLLGDQRPRVTFTLSGIVFDACRTLLCGHDVRSVPAKWGNVKISFCDYDGGRLIGLPHLSRYRLFAESDRGEERGRIVANLIADHPGSW